MKRLALTALAALSAAFTLTTSQSANAADVGVSISVSQPGVYGRIDIGRFPQPAVVVAQPVFIERPYRVATPPQPVYLWVPPGHQKHWSKHCGEYHACGVPVYFVRDEWYRQNVMAGGPLPREREEMREREHGRDKDRDRDDERGEGRGHGKGKKGHRD